jgi:prefoldin subunit 5
MAVERWTDEMVDKLAESVKELRQESEEFREELKELNIRFGDYQQASQWVVNLAFGLLATATITTIVTAVFRK